MSPPRRRSLTGIKPTGVPHLGNYLGAIRPALELAKANDAFYFIADLHALTSTPSREELIEQTYSVAATWLALGLDPEETHFYRQSDIPEVTQLAWLLSCVLPLGMLTRAHSFKEAVDNRGLAPDDVRHGLFSYPVLMAADILLFDADVVPVGKDQKQHLEIAQEAARKVNLTYGEGTLKIPEAAIDERVMTIPGIDGEKMSKSRDNGVDLFMDDKPLKKRIGKIVTDSRALGEPLFTEKETVFQLYSLFADAAQVDLLRRQYASGRKDPARADDAFADPSENYFGWGHAKGALFEVVRDTFSGARGEYQRLMADRAYLDQVLARGADKAREVATPVLERVWRAVGIRPA
ncbi:MAG: tryptophan--tRNA ligase [Deltaproteobacteria bacterium]|nr:tryptophan--tRNA ligase [Deltaproteobacteria bacterium]